MWLAILERSKALGLDDLLPQRLLVGGKEVVVPQRVIDPSAGGDPILVWPAMGELAAALRGMDREQRAATVEDV
jgi:hypothetical protein